MDDQTKDILQTEIRTALKYCYQIQEYLKRHNPPKEQIARLGTVLSQTATLIQLLVDRAA